MFYTPLTGSFIYSYWLARKSISLIWNRFSTKSLSKIWRSKLKHPLEKSDRLLDEKVSSHPLLTTVATVIVFHNRLATWPLRIITSVFKDSQTKE
jgi:hypothetical protein